MDLRRILPIPINFVQSKMSRRNSEEKLLESENEGLIELESPLNPVEGITLKPKLKIKLLCPISIQWFRLEEEDRKVLVCQMLPFTPKEKDVGKKFELCVILICHKKGAKRSFFTEEVSPFPKIKIERNFEKISSSSENSFKLISYNVQHPSRVQNNKLLSEFNMDQEYRNKLIFSELDLLNGDIICLQEVSKNDVDWWSNELTKQNFKMFKADDLFEFEILTFLKLDKFKGIKKYFINYDKSLQKLFTEKQFNETKKFALIMELERIKDGKQIFLINSQLSENYVHECETLMTGMRSILKDDQFEKSSIILCLSFTSKENEIQIEMMKHFQNAYNQIFQIDFPQYTKYSEYFQSTDSVLFSNLNVISGMEIHKHENYPSINFPSDHPSMVFEME
jgi:hypothetical protein